MTIGGALSLTQPGDTGQLTATVRFSDGTSRDVTAQAIWSSALGIVAIAGPGSVKALRYGKDNVVARYERVTAVAAARVAPPGAFLIQGVVTGTAGAPLPQALVEVSSRCGTMSTETDTQGTYWLPAEGETTIRVSMDSYVPGTLEVIVEVDGHFDIELQAVEVPGTISGDYTLSVTPAPSCAFPPGLFPRKYNAHIRDSSGRLVVELSGAQFALWTGGKAGFTGTRDGNTLRFAVSDGFADDYNFVELLSPGWLWYTGTGLGDIQDKQISATFSGLIEYDRTDFVVCTASDHHFEFVPIDR
jgi:hypothetical protein